MNRALHAAAAFALAITAWHAPASAQDDARARKLMEEAFDRRYRWDEGLKGFSADFVLIREGKPFKGTIHADVTKPRGGVEVSCDDPATKAVVGETLASTVTHTRASRFDRAFDACAFSPAGDGPHGGTKIAIAGHPFFKDFTVKDGHIIENHGGRGEMSTEVKVAQVVWVAAFGKTVPREYSFKVKTGDREQSGSTTEDWREVDGVLLPAWFRLVRTEGTTPAESMLRLENFKVER